MKFCSEYLFPRFKFLKKGDIVRSDERRAFAAFVKRHLPLPDDMVFDEKWDGLIAPTIVKKYTDMRCNVNAHVHDVYMGEYKFVMHCDLTDRQSYFIPLFRKR